MVGGLQCEGATKDTDVKEGFTSGTLPAHAYAEDSDVKGTIWCKERL